MDKHIPNAEIRRVWLDAALTSAEAAKALGLSRGQLWKRAKAMGLPGRPEGRRPVIPEAILRPLWLANVQVSDIADLFKCPPDSVRQSARRYNLPQRPKGRHPLITLEAYRQKLIGQHMARQAKTEAAARRQHDARFAAE